MKEEKNNNNFCEFLEFRARRESETIIIISVEYFVFVLMKILIKILMDGKLVTG